MSWWTSQRLHPKVKNKFIVVFGSDFFIPSVKSLNKPKVEFDTKEYRLINHTFNYPGNAKWQPITIKFVDMNGDINPAMRTEFFDTSAFLWQIMNNTGYRYPYHNVSNFRENHYRKENQTGGDSSGHWIATKIDDEAVGAGWRTITTPEKSSTIANSFGAGLSDKPDFLPASAARQRISIYQIDPDGYTVELWHLINPIVKSVGWGDLDYTSDEPVEYELQVVYDWAVLDRKAIGKKPAYDAQSFSKFMKTIYIENEIDLDGDLEDKIEELKKRDKENDERAEQYSQVAASSLANLRDSEIGSEEYNDALDRLNRAREVLDEVETERLAMEGDLYGIGTELQEAGIPEGEPLSELIEETNIFADQDQSQSTLETIEEIQQFDLLNREPEDTAIPESLDLGSTTEAPGILDNVEPYDEAAGVVGSFEDINKRNEEVYKKLGTTGTERQRPENLEFPDYGEEPDTSVYQGSSNPFSKLGDGTAIPEGSGPVRAGREPSVNLSDIEEEEDAPYILNVYKTKPRQETE